MNDNEKVYLKQNLLAEPLVNQWPAWPYLIAPAMAAMYMANSHLKIMQSFISAPQVHINALKNPKMIGGPFMNHDASKIDEVKSLLDRTLKEQSEMFELAEAIKSLDEMLGREADGSSLEPLYPKVPDALGGFVELVYDLNNRPSVRLIEGLMYKSSYYQPSRQSLAMSLITEDERAFVFSTPRLESDRRFHLKRPFSDRDLDELFSMREIQRPLGYIKDVLQVEAPDNELFSSFFTTEKRPSAAPYTGDGVRVRYFGHACLLIESKEVNILCDPLIGYQYNNGIPRYTHADLPESIDYVVITHSHQDHIVFETLLQLRYKIKHIVIPKNDGRGLADPSLKMVLQNIGFENVIEIDEMESIAVKGGAIMGLPFLGEHADLAIRSKMAYLINLKGNRILCAADSNNIDPRLYERLHKLIGDIDILFIGMECDGAPLSWLYGSLLTKPLTRKMDQSRRFDGSDHPKAMDIIERLKPKQVYVYAMGQEPWLTFLIAIQYTPESRPIIESDKVVRDCRERGIVAERMFGQKEIFLESRMAASAKL